MDKGEVIRTRQVDPDIICKKCIHRNGGQEYPHYTKSYCAIYDSGRGKPADILWNKGDCQYYLEDLKWEPDFEK